MADTINISGLDRAEVFRLLYNNARVLGMGALQAIDGDMSAEEAQSIFANGGATTGGDYPIYPRGELYFDYYHGRVMKVDLSKDDLNPALYDRDNGPGSALRALAPLLGNDKEGRQ